MIRFAVAFLLTLSAAAVAAPRNIVLILSDDHRYDFMAFHPGAPEFLETPNLDRMAREGAHLANAFVTTSLCSPSRASILTGQYMHHHNVVDNQRPIPEGTTFFSQYLRENGYTTAYVGKWHMGHDSDERQPGFDHWVSFVGQGEYFNPTYNINGRRQKFEGYNADLLTDQAIKWLNEGRDKSKPFLLYVGYKAVHYPFQPAPRNLGRYEAHKIAYPPTMANTEANYQTQSRWIRDRRYSIHGVDHMETGNYDNDPVPSFPDLYKRYCETVYSLDENIGRLLGAIDEAGLSNNTLVLYLGDNGFALGEHGFYDKRDAFEESIRVPMVAWGPGLIQPGMRVEQMVLNIDIAPTMLELAGIEAPGAAKFDGRSFLSLLKGQSPGKPWRDHILYEYHWEWNFPATPTLFAIRTDRYKYIYYHGVWDSDGFYDLQTDPHERVNLIHVPAYREQIEKLRAQMFQELGASGALNVPVRVPAGERLDERKLRR